MVARTKILAGILTLLVIAGATLGIAARLLAQRREAEAALLGAPRCVEDADRKRCLIDAVVVARPGRGRPARCSGPCSPAALVRGPVAGSGPA